jgi:chromate reductase
LARLACGLAQGQVDAEFVDLLDYPMPLYNADIEAAGMPEAVTRLAERIKAADALVISTPEYNGSISSVLKTTIDWVSRVKTSPWKDKPILLLGASPGALGAVRGLWHSRQPLEVLGAFVHPEMLGVPKAHEAFDEKGQFKDAAQTERLRVLLGSFLSRLG